MKLKLIGLLITLSFYPVGVQATKDHQSIYWGLTEYLHSKFIVKLSNEQYKLAKNKASFTEEEFKKQQHMFLCYDAFMHLQYKTFLKESGYKPRQTTISFLDEEEKTLEKDFKKYEPDCSFDDEYIEKLLESVLESKDEL